MPGPRGRLTETASQTAGPYVHVGCLPRLAGVEGVLHEEIGARAVSEGARGEAVTITGSILDGTGWPVRDAMLESWQADAAGLFAGQEGADPAVRGFCRFAVDAESAEWTLRTVKPGPVRGRGGLVWAPHIALWIVARGINVGLQTRIYFADEDSAADPLLARIEQRPRVETLMARPEGQGAYRFDIRLQGEGETVFLDL